MIAAEQVRDPTGFGLENLEKAMTLFYRQKYGDTKESANSGDAEELVLSAFGGTCFNCGQKGHKKHECSNAKKSNGKPKFGGKCRHCGKTGHKETGC